MASLSLGEAAEQAGTSKSTISLLGVISRKRLPVRNLKRRFIWHCVWLSGLVPTNTSQAGRSNQERRIGDANPPRSCAPRQASGTLRCRTRPRLRAHLGLCRPCECRPIHARIRSACIGRARLHTRSPCVSIEAVLESVLNARRRAGRHFPEGRPKSASGGVDVALMRARSLAKYLPRP